MSLLALPEIENLHSAVRRALRRHSRQQHTFALTNGRHEASVEGMPANEIVNHGLRPLLRQLLIVVLYGRH